MLTVEEIKQAVEFADGFEIQGCVIVLNKELYYDIQRFSTGMSEGYCDLFFDRTIQGMHRSFTDDDRFLSMTVYADSIGVLFPNRFSLEKSFKHNGTTEGIREAREKAIRFVLEEME